MNVFDHPRSIISDYVLAQILLQHAIRELFKDRLFLSGPVVVIHVRAILEGGLTQPETRALMELALGAGARDAYIWSGRELVDQDFASGRFPGDHWFPEKPQWADSQE